MAKIWGMTPNGFGVIGDDGQPTPHWLVKNLQQRQARIEAERQAIQAKKNDPFNRQNYSPEGLKNLAAQHEQNIFGIKTTGEAADLDKARGEWTAITQRRAELLTAARKRKMADISPVEYENARDEIRRMVKAASNVNDIARRFEAITDPAQRIAAHSMLADLAKEKFPNTPANGSLAGSIERDRTAYFETKESLAELDKAAALMTAASEAGILAQRDHNNDFAGLGYDAAFAAGRGAYHSKIQALSGEIAEYLGISDLAQVETNFITLGEAESAGGFFGVDPARQPAPAVSEGAK